MLNQPLVPPVEGTPEDQPQICAALVLVRADADTAEPMIMTWYDTSTGPFSSSEQIKWSIEMTTKLLDFIAAQPQEWSPDGWDREDLDYLVYALTIGLDDMGFMYNEFADIEDNEETFNSVFEGILEQGFNPLADLSVLKPE